MKFEELHPMAPVFKAGSVHFVNVPGAALIVKEIVEDDCYHLDRIPDGSMIFDVGGCYGEFGLICAIEKKCKVAMYEPSRMNWQIAGLNYKLNEDQFEAGDILMFHAAIGGEENLGREFFYVPNHPAGSGFCMIGGELELVPTLRLSDQIVLRKTSSPVVVKFDCEGAEREIFDQDPGWMSMADIITMEWHYTDGEHYRDILQSHGFEVSLEGLPHEPWHKELPRGMIFAQKS